MVKVTFNSALAQKEAKKDEPKSSEEALIVPPDAVAVDCKVLAGVAGGVPAAGTGALDGPQLPGTLVCVQRAGRGGVLTLATPRGDSCTGVRAPAALHLACSPGNLQRQAPPPPPPPSLALFFQYKYCA